MYYTTDGTEAVQKSHTTWMEFQPNLTYMEGAEDQEKQRRHLLRATVLTFHSASIQLMLQLMIAIKTHQIQWLQAIGQPRDYCNGRG